MMKPTFPPLRIPDGLRIPKVTAKPKCRSGTTSTHPNVHANTKASSAKASGQVVELSVNDVICGRGRHCADHSGNKRFARIVAEHLDEYRAATSKLDKSLLVSCIIDSISRSSPNGGFVRRNASTGLFEKVNTRTAREKVGQELRDSLHTEFKSSTQSKRQLRRNNMNSRINQVNNIFQGNQKILDTVAQLQSQIREDMADNQVEELFDRTNLIILSLLKQSLHITKSEELK